jgi:hypothetical protein
MKIVAFQVLPLITILRVELSGEGVVIVTSNPERGFG